jgi:hypothetical protein
MGEKGNIADVSTVAVESSHHVVTDTLASGVDLVAGIATGAVTGAATGIAKDKVDDKLKKRDEPTG